ncbi:F-box domain-containing protein [Mycena indigotica]|uniref:F-box domain-containing protein n=1 Tax=Mycena indigotica TaxID=2126181 RepID=A0A8H6VU42_9AGAR|nr:F-box domain-containing protein [Mycena indigotica]KAF7290163.1 F-box domain-containing protein [Mycena indigotica]
MAPPNSGAQTLTAADVLLLRQEAEAIDETITALKAQLVQLEDRQKAIQDKLSTLTFPVQTLPAEIFCHIFRATLSSTDPRKVNAMLLSITAVCQRWRRIAIADPNLWTTTCYFLQGRDHFDPVFSHFLERTQGLPITVHVDAREESWLPPPLFTSCRQWKEASLSLAGANAIKIGLGLDSASIDNILDLPHLTKLTLDLGFYMEYQEDQTFSNAPLLRDLAIGDAVLISGLGFPVHQLQKLTLLHTLSLSDLVALLPQLVVLEDLTLCDECDEGDVQSTQPPVEMPCLTTLRLSGYHSHTIMAYVLLPRLRNLELSDLDGVTAESDVLECLSRSSANVSSLSIADTEYSTFSTLLNSPAIGGALRDLTIGSLQMGPSDNAALVALFSRADFLPNIESLMFVPPPVASFSSFLHTFLDGLAQRVADASLRGLAHEIKLQRLLVQPSAPATSLRAEDLRAVRDLQQRLNIHGHVPDKY